MNKKFYLSGLLFILFSFLISCTTENKVSTKVITFNVRYDNPEDSLNNWKYRKTSIGEMIRYYNPDVWGAQEVLHHQLIDLKKELPSYNNIGVGREDGKTKGEYSPIFYKKNRYKLIQSGNFSISETPEKIGVKGWDAACERIATWAILEDVKNKHSFFFLNTHLDHVGIKARREGSKLIQQKAKELGQGMPIIVTGDFNATPNSDTYKAMTEDRLLKSSHEVAPIVYGPNWTFHNFNRVPLEKRSLIDFIFVSKNMKIIKSAVIDDKADNGKRYLSDHCPILTEIQF
jgi:endonuclease/exonuclease/phosphatase family metal-dependent hydrolase